MIGDTAQMDKLNRRLVKVNKGHNDECKQLLTLMGIPYVEAPCEAEVSHTVKCAFIFCLFNASY